MYRYGQRQRHHKKVAVFIFFAIIIGLAYTTYVFFQEDTKDEIKNSAATETHIEDNRVANVTLNQPDFMISTPATWTLYQKSEAPKNKIYYLKSTEKNTARTLVIYVDGDTATYAVNRTVPVSTAGDKLSVGQVSDTCSNFVGQGNNQTASKDQSLPDTIAKWQNISFLCDLSHSNRNAVGISSTEGINKIGVAGKSGAKHDYFFLYTDHSNSPDTTIFTEILRSFIAK